MIDLLALFGTSLIAIFLIGLLIRWLYPLAAPAQLQIEDFQSQLHNHGHQNQIVEMLVSLSGREAIARLTNNSQFAVIRRLGDSYSLRTLPANHIHYVEKKTKTTISINDFTWPAFHLSHNDGRILAAWIKVINEQSHA